MKKVEFQGLDQSYYTETLENGLQIYVLPYENKNQYHISLVTRFGSNDTSFIPVGEKQMVTVPNGIAHFLEHKMFETEEGEDPFTFFSKSGSDSNAYTSYDQTAYILSGTENFAINLDYLLTYVYIPYFTDENVEKEKGIIAEEIKMYEDDPERMLMEQIRQATYQVDPYRISIGGKVEDIQKITKEDLYKTYNTFYTPSNMALFVTGSMDPEMVIDVCKKNQALMSRQKTKMIIRKKVEEPKKVTKKYQKEEANIKNTKFAFTIKTLLPKDKDRFIYSASLGLCLDSLFGSSSVFREEVREEKLATGFTYYRDLTNDYLCLCFLGESDYPDEFIKKVLDTLEKKDFTENDVNRIRKVWLSGEVMRMDSPRVVLRDMQDDWIEYGRVMPERCDTLRSITYEEARTNFENLSLEETATVILVPKNKGNFIKN